MVVFFVCTQGYIWEAHVHTSGYNFIKKQKYLFSQVFSEMWFGCWFQLPMILGAQHNTLGAHTDLERMLLWVEEVEGSTTRVEEHEVSSHLKVLHIWKWNAKAQTKEEQAKSLSVGYKWRDEKNAQVTLEFV